MTDFNLSLHEYTDKINAALKACIPAGTDGAGRLREAMHYSLLAGGKRIRPVLLLESARIAGGSVEEAMPFACAAECIHTYSLIHDDLPCMDNDDLRRGKPTNHIVYGETVALLAGDGLLNYAFELMLGAKAPKDAERRLSAARELAYGAGINGMIGGQMADISGETGSETALTRMCGMKTGALIRASVRAGAILGGADDVLLAALTEYAKQIGLAFQMVDDYLDVAGNAESLGKNTGSDERDGKITFATLLGAENCRERAKKITQSAIMAADGLKDGAFLSELAHRLCSRMI